VNRRVALIGFDGAESELVARGIGEGWLPGIRRLAARGRTALLDPEGMPFPSAAWTTAITGTPPEEHLLLLPQQLRPASYLIQPVGPAAARRPPFWVQASGAGIRSTIVGARAVPFVSGLRGTQVLGWGHPPAEAPHERQVVEPRELTTVVHAIAGRKPPRLPSGAVRSLHGIGTETARLISSARRHGRLLREMARRTEWEFLFGSFGEAHLGGHLLWNADHADGFADIRSPLARIYRAIDAEVDELARALPQDTLLFLFTPHGMTANPNPSDPIGPVLERGGWLVRRRRDRAPMADPKLRAWQRARRLGRTVVPLSLRRRFWRDVAPASWIERRDRAASLAAAASIDWSATRAFALPGDVVSHVRINLAGREPEGIVRPGAEYRSLCHELASGLQRLVDAESGRRVVRRVVIVEDLIGLPVEDVLPDVVVEWIPGHSVRRIASPACGEIEVPSGDPRTGNHRPPGFLVVTDLAAADVTPHGVTTWPGEAPHASVLDVAPSVLRALGITSPEALGGRPIEGLALDHHR